MEKVKQNVSKNWKTTQVVSKNVVELVNAAALAAVAGFAIHQSLHEQSVAYKTLLFAGVLIAVQAAYLFVKSLNKQPAKK